MGRFASTVALYEHLRPPYPPEFFRSVAERLKLSHQHALIDLGTGPGLLALGFAPYVGRITGVDPEPAMLAAAREAATRAGRHVTLIEGKAETLPDEIGPFDIVTIGRALHWMDRDSMLARLPQLLARDGAIAICSSFSATDGRNSWLDDYNAACRAWSDPKLWDESRSGAKTHRDLTAFFAGSVFQIGERITVDTSHEISMHDLARRVLTFSPSSPHVLGDKVGPMLRDVEQRLTPFARDGMISEAVVAVAEIVRR